MMNVTFCDNIPPSIVAMPQFQRGPLFSLSGRQQSDNLVKLLYSHWAIGNDWLPVVTYQFASQLLHSSWCSVMGTTQSKRETL
jgi:hypothetical protein